MSQLGRKQPPTSGNRAKRSAAQRAWSNGGVNIRKDRLVAALEGMDHEEIAAAVIKCGDGDVQTNRAHGGDAAAAGRGAR